MAAPTPARKRAPAKKARAPKSAEPEKKSNLAWFEDYRDRAHAQIGPKPEVAPFMLGEDEGFYPPIEFGFPERTALQIELTELVKNNEIYRVMQIMTGDQFVRLCDTFDRLTAESRAAGDDITTAELLLALWMRIDDHFKDQIGPGSGDVPGGSPAS